MAISEFIRSAARDGRLVSAHPSIDEAGDPRADDAFTAFHRLPIYRCYLHPLDRQGLGRARLTELSGLTDLDLVREPGARPRQARIVVFIADEALGVLPHEDSLLVDKFERRGLPVVATLIGAEPTEAPDRQLAVEIALLYPPHPTTDEAIELQDRNRRDGLLRLREKPDRALRLTRDPLSAGHVFPDYFGH